MNKIKVILICFLSFFYQKTFACNCNPGGTIEENVHAANVILKVRVLSISYSDRLDTINVVIEGDPKNVFSKYWKFYVKIYNAVVEETYKGKMSSDTIRIITGMNGASCSLAMVVNAPESMIHSLTGNPDLRLAKRLTEMNALSNLSALLGMCIPT